MPSQCMHVGWNNPPGRSIPKQHFRMSGRPARHILTYQQISCVCACSHLSRSRIRLPPDYTPFFHVLLNVHEQI
jgi:hypothetical protein